jgi:hypothetical protein
MVDPDKREPCANCKSYIDLKLEVVEEKFKAIAAAKIAERTEIDAHLGRLNHEGVRIADMTSKTVSTDTWNGFIKQYEERHIALEKLATNAATKKEFQDYKDVTQTALQLAQGKSSGISFAATFVITAISVAAAVVSTVAILVHLKYG